MAALKMKQRNRLALGQMGSPRLRSRDVFRKREQFAPSPLATAKEAWCFIFDGLHPPPQTCPASASAERGFLLGRRCLGRVIAASFRACAPLALDPPALFLDRRQADAVAGSAFQGILASEALARDAATAH